jgi:hypothetical protein
LLSAFLAAAPVRRRIADISAEGDTARLPGALIQPIAAEGMSCRPSPAQPPAT